MSERDTSTSFYDPDFSEGGVNIRLSHKRMHRTSLRKRLVGEVDFLPDGTARPYSRPLSESLSAGLNGLQSFFDSVDAGDYPEPDYLTGRTGKGIALLAKNRLGCTVKKAKTDLPMFDVVGRTTAVREKLQEITGKTNTQGRNRMGILRNRMMPH